MLVRLLFRLFLVWLFLPFPFPGQNGAYNSISEIYYCRDEWACQHEYAHWLDDEAGWISQEFQFHQDLRTYLISQIRLDTDPNVYRITEMMGENWFEIYAYLYVVYGGNVPASLAKYYPEPGGEAKTITLPFEFGYIRTIVN